MAGDAGVGTLLAGCAGDTENGTDTTQNPGEGTNDEPATSDDSYTVTMQPVGEMSFERPPKQFVVYHQGWTDIVLSLGQRDGLVGAAYPERFPTEYYDALPSISVDLSDVMTMKSGGTVDAEIFYEIDADLHLVDPNAAKQYFELDDEDFRAIEQQVAPFFGSYLRRPQFTDEYPYYSLYEGVRKAGQVFQVEERVDAFEQIHSSLLEDVSNRLPDERPTVGYLNVLDGNVYARDPTVPGYQTKSLRDLEFEDAFAGQYEGQSYIQTDFEGLLEADPEVIVFHAGANLLRQDEHDAESLRATFEDHPVARRVTAVENERIFFRHEFEQGPVIKLFQTEALAKGLYPDEFGEPQTPGEIPTEERLFDRSEVAGIISDE